jgi:hypothetical protein
MGLHRTPGATPDSAAPVGRPDVGVAHRSPSRQRLCARRRLCPDAGGRTPRGAAGLAGPEVPGLARGAPARRRRPRRARRSPGARVPPPRSLATGRAGRTTTTAGWRRGGRPPATLRTRATRAARTTWTARTSGTTRPTPAPPSASRPGVRTPAARDRRRRPRGPRRRARGAPLWRSHERAARIPRLVPDGVGTTPAAGRARSSRCWRSAVAETPVPTPGRVDLVALQDQAGARQQPVAPREHGNEHRDAGETGDDHPDQPVLVVGAAALVRRWRRGRRRGLSALGAVARHQQVGHRGERDALAVGRLGRRHLLCGLLLRDHGLDVRVVVRWGRRLGRRGWCSPLRRRRRRAGRARGRCRPWPRGCRRRRGGGRRLSGAWLRLPERSGRPADEQPEPQQCCQGNATGRRPPAA